MNCPLHHRFYEDFSRVTVWTGRNSILGDSCDILRTRNAGVKTRWRPGIPEPWIGECEGDDRAVGLQVGGLQWLWLLDLATNMKKQAKSARCLAARPATD